MAGPAWELFAGLVFVLTLGVVGLARTSAKLLQVDEPLAGDRPIPETVGGLTLVANLTATHLAIAGVVAGIIVLTGVPWETIGLVGVPDFIAAVLLGIGVYAVNEGMGWMVRAMDRTAPERYREFLAPDRPEEWLFLLVVALPVVAFGEELLFRGALVGGLAAATGLSPWLLAVASSIAFGMAHTAQGPLGVGVAGVLGLALAAGFVLTGDLLLVVIAHYLVNALEFTVHEGLGIDLPG